MFVFQQWKLNNINRLFIIQNKSNVDFDWERVTQKHTQYLCQTFPYEINKMKRKTVEEEEDVWRRWRWRQWRRWRWQQSTQQRQLTTSQNIGRRTNCHTWQLIAFSMSEERERIWQYSNCKLSCACTVRCVLTNIFGIEPRISSELH